MVSANNVFSCSLCNVFFRPSERRKVFRSSSDFLALLKQVHVAADVFGKADKLPDEFLLRSKLYIYAVHGIDGLRLRFS